MNNEFESLIEKRDHNMGSWLAARVEQDRKEFAWMKGVFTVLAACAVALTISMIAFRAMTMSLIIS